MKTRFHFSSSRGSALVTVMMLSMGLMVILAAILGLSLNERRMNYRENMRLEARNAAEAVSEYGLSQVRQLMQSVSDFTSTRFTSAEGSLHLPPTTFWSGGNVSSSGTTGPELIVGLVAPVTQSNTTSLYYYSSTDPDNANDPLKGCYAFRFDIKVISKATVVPPAGGAGSPQTCYMTQTLSTRASPLFSYAVFYNMDMEISPGPTMNIIGAVHANGSLYARKNSSSNAALNFVGPVTVSGGVYANVAKYPTTNADGSIDNMLSGTDNVYYSTAAGGLTGMKDTSSGMWRDQMWGTTTENATTQASFRTWSSQTYQGNLQSSVHGIQPSVPSGIPPYDPTTANPGTPNYDVGNGARNFIVPALLSTNTGNHTMDNGYDANIETQKYARKSGLYIVVNPTSIARAGIMPGGSTNDLDGSAFTVPPFSYRAFDGSGNEVILPGQKNYGVGNATDNTAHTNYNGGTAVITIRKREMVDMRRANYNFLSTRSVSNSYLPKVINTIDVDITELKKAVDRTTNGLSQSSVYTTVAPTTTNWSHFIYNPAATPQNVAISDANLITDTSTSLHAAGGWNGGVYIYSIDADQQPLQSDNATANTLFRNNTEPSGVRLINGRGRVASATAATSTCELGLTIATNDALYILGHYNADGTVVTTTTGTTNDGTSNSGRYYETGEQPCSVVSDATTILSAPTYTNNSGTITQTSGWNDGLSMLTESTSNWTSAWRTTAPSSSNTVDGDNFNSAGGWGYGSGTGYTSAPTVAITGGGATTNATAIATILNGQVIGATITSGGAGYTSPPTVTLTGGGFTAAATLTATVLDGQVIALNPTPPAVTLTGGGYTTADTATAVVTDGQVTAILPASGVGYTTVPTVTLSGGGATTQATALATIAGGKVTSVMVITSGVGYTSTPTVAFSGGGTPTTTATATATVLSGKVVSINLTGGAGYSSAPTVSIAAPATGTQATSAVATIASGKLTGIQFSGALPYVLPYAKESNLQTASAFQTTKFSGSTTEISTAILTGLVVSNKNGVHQAAGGVHNFPRFLESHSGTVAIRGSLVAMYESRVATEPFSLRVYGPPTRLWGFNELFNQGKFPPLTPTAMSYRRIDFNDINAAQYSAAKTSFGL